MEHERVLAHFVVEQIGEFSSTTTLHFNHKKIVITSVIKEHTAALKHIIMLLKEHDILNDFSTLDAVGHRVVHGGEVFQSATYIDEKVLSTIQDLIPLAPLHNKANLEGIKALMSEAPDIPQIAVFDTAFHTTMPKEAFIYALEYQLYEQHQIRRYGFHGSSHAYVLQQSAQYLDIQTNRLNLISLHLGNGASACAVKDGVSIDTSMGFTPLEGLVMGSRCGDIDPAIVLYLQRELNMNVDEVDTLLNKNSGLFGLCGENDLRSILERNDEKAKLAINIMCRRIKKYIGAYMALLGRVDAIVFTGGIGENSAYIRQKILEDFPFGVELDKERNAKSAVVISTQESSVKLLVVQTDEELYIARESRDIIA